MIVKRKKNKIITCVLCKKEFRDWRYHKFCSLKCAVDFKRQNIKVKCKWCGKVYFVTKTRLKYTKYCSKKCFDCAQKEPRKKIKCNNCGKIIIRRIGKLKGHKKHFCCRKCYLVFNRGKNHYEYKELKHLTHDGYKLDRWAMDVKKRDGYICRECGCKNSSYIQAHHIKDVLNNNNLKFNINNGVSLCIKCHAKKHNDDIGLYNFIMSCYKKKKKIKEDTLC